MASGENTFDNLFSALIDNLQLVIDQIKNGESKKEGAADFTLEAFWSRIDPIVKRLSAEATKLCMAFSQPPLPSAQDCAPLTERVEQLSLALVSAYYVLPTSQGIYLQKSTQQGVLAIMRSLQALCEVIKRESCHGSNNHLQSTGGVWEYCDSFTQLPKDNKACVYKLGKDTLDLVSDALEELEEEQKEGEKEEEEEGEEEEEEEPKWSQQDRKLLAPSVGLIKVAKATMKKVLSAVKSNGNCDSAEHISELDSLGERLEKLSPAVDELSASLYPPINHTHVSTHAEDLAAGIEDLLQVVKHIHITGESDASWVEFLTKALHHNQDKVKTELVPS